MNIRKKLLCLCFFLLSILAFGLDVDNSKDLIQGELDNGMKYYIFENAKPKNRVSVNVLVHAGSLQEEDDQQGMAHLIEHLCFNGTEKYDKNEVVKYYQSIGMSFGGDLNAHTSFDETVYKIQIPTDNKENFEKGMDVLKEMTLNPTFKQEEIDSERYIVQEEWRLSQGLRGRISKLFQKEVFGDSRYGKRFPIGKMDIVLGTKRPVLKRFYDKWYQPKNMAVVMVGDIDPSYAKEVIEKYFDVKRGENFKPSPDYRLGEIKDKYVVFTDPELTDVALDMTAKTTRDFSSKEALVRDSIEHMLFRNLFQNRVTARIKEGDSSLYGAGYYASDFRKDRLETFYAEINKRDISKGIREAVLLLKDFAVNGVSEEELEVEKENLENLFTLQVRNQDSIESDVYVAEIRKIFLEGDVFSTPEEALSYFKAFSKEIAVSDINERAKAFYEAQKVSLLLAPDMKGVKVPTEREMKEDILVAENTKVEKRAPRKMQRDLVPPKLEAGRIASIADLGTCKKITLSNGLTFFYKQTDFEEDRIYLNFRKQEGSLYDRENMYWNSKFASLVGDSGAGNIAYEDMTSFSKGKDFSVSTYIDTFEEGAVLVSSKKDFKTALNYLTYLLREARVSEKAFDYVMTSKEEELENRDLSPKAAFRDKIVEVFFKNNLKKRAMTLKDLDFVTEEGILEEYQRKFTNFAGFEGILVGSISEEEMRETLEEYFAGLPARIIPKSCGREWLNIAYPEGALHEKVVKGTDKKVTVALYYPIYSRYFVEDEYFVNTFAGLLRMQIIDEVREKLGGVYGAGVSVSYNRHEQPYLRLQFSTDPKRAEEISTAIRAEVKSLVKGSIKAESLHSIVENYKLRYEDGQERNAYWIGYLEDKIDYGTYYEPMKPADFAREMNERKLRSFFSGILNPENYTEVMLIPEKVEEDK